MFSSLIDGYCFEEIDSVYRDFLLAVRSGQSGLLVFPPHLVDAVKCSERIQISNFTDVETDAQEPW